MRKKKPTKKPRPLSPELRAVRAAIERALGDSSRVARRSERAAGRGKGRIPDPPEVAKDDPRHRKHLTVCVYAGTAPAGAMPVDMQTWDNFVVRYGISPKAAKPMKVALLAGENITYASNIAGMITIFAVLEAGRAIDDTRKALLLTTKAIGVLN